MYKLNLKNKYYEKQLCYYMILKLVSHYFHLIRGRKINFITYFIVIDTYKINQHNVPKVLD